MRSKALNMLVEHHIKPSYQRLTILECLIENNTHPTADCVYRLLSDRVPAISRATVYNTLALFVENGIVSTMISGRNELRYDVVTEAHGHFICDRCERIFNFPYTYQNRYAELEGYDVKSEEIVLRGVCRECSMRQDERHDAAGQNGSTK